MTDNDGLEMGGWAMVVLAIVGIAIVAVIVIGCTLHAEMHFGGKYYRDSDAPIGGVSMDIERIGYEQDAGSNSWQDAGGGIGASQGERVEDSDWDSAAFDRLRRE